MKTKQFGLCRALACAIILTIPLAAFGRLVKSWSYQEMFDQADLVVVAKPVSTKDTAEKAVLPDITPDVPFVGIETKFDVQLVMKGGKDVRRFTLHHYRLEHPTTILGDGPALAAFDPNDNHKYLLFLKKEADGRYVPVAGQTDPAIFCVIKLEGMAQ